MTQRRGSPSMATRETYNVYAIHGSKRKLVAKRVGAFKASRVVSNINQRGFEAELKRVN